MKKIFTACILFAGLSASAQKILHGSNAIKLNLLGLPLNNYSLQYERKLNNRMSAALSFRVMPSSGLPFKNTIADAIGDNDVDVQATVKSFRMSNIAITPEFRFYIGRKGNMRGFYVAPFYRFANFKVENLVVSYTDDLNAKQQVSLSGKQQTHTFGAGIGKQWILGKMVVLDWLIFAPHFGVGNGTFTGVSSQTLSAQEQADLYKELDDLDIPLTTKKITVNANGATMGLSGSWGGLRSSLSIGIRF